MYVNSAACGTISSARAPRPHPRAAGPCNERAVFGPPGQVAGDKNSHAA